MDTAVSAFAIYNKNKQNQPQQQGKKKNKNKKGTKNSATKPPKVEYIEDVMKTVAKKLKDKQKQTKNIGKKKTHKKKKAKAVKNKVSAIETKKKASANEPEIHYTEFYKSELTDSDDVPSLVPINRIQQSANEEDLQSHSSHSSGIEFVPVQTNSIDEGLKVFHWMIAPYDPDDFFYKVWERKPLFIARKKPLYYKELISTPMIDDILRKENIQYTKNIDVTSYVDKKRETHNPVGRALPHVVWDYYLNGCSVRLLNPQTYIPKLHLLNATLQEYFNSFVGANSYLTPPDSQGFAPHYDDIEAFILQIEGKKLWKVYKPLSGNEILPRVSSKNFDQNEIGKPIMEVTLEAGDMLYFPRGYIHQGVTIDGEHSLHITISMYQKHSWADLFEKLLPEALQTAINECSELRCGLPFDIYDNFGLVNSDINTPRKREITDVMKSLFDKIKDHLPIDTAVDEMAKKFQHDALPPVLSDFEKSVTVFGDSDVMIDNGKIINRVEIGLDTRIRLLRKNILRMVMEDEAIRLYYHIENSLEYHGSDPQFLEIDEHLAPAIETLLMSYPEYVFVENLDVPGEADKLQIASDLWERGLVMTEYPSNVIEDD